MNEINATVLPAFRVVGLQKISCATHLLKDWQELMHSWYLGNFVKKWQVFSRTVYTILAYHEHGITLTVGCLFSDGALLPEHAAEIWVLPQNYAVINLATHGIQIAWEALGCLSKQTDYAGKIDFVAFSTSGQAMCYAGLLGEVEMVEEIF